MRHLSFSQFRTFDTCPRRYWHIYLKPDGKRPLPTADMRDGTDRHAEIAAAIDHGAYELLPNAWGDYLKAKADEGWIFMAEYQCEVDTPAAPIRCVIDVLMISPDGTSAEIIDWKANSLPDEQQLQVYAIATMTDYPEVQRVKCSYAATERDMARHFRWDAEDVAGFYRVLRRRAGELVEMGDSFEAFVKRPSPACQQCAFARECVAETNVLPFEDLAIEQVVEMAYMAAGLEAQCRERVRIWMDETKTDEVYVNGEGFKLSWSATMRTAKQKGVKS